MKQFINSVDNVLTVLSTNKKLTVDIKEDIFTVSMNQNKLIYGKAIPTGEKYPDEHTIERELFVQSENYKEFPLVLLYSEIKVYYYNNSDCQKLKVDEDSIAGGSKNKRYRSMEATSFDIFITWLFKRYPETKPNLFSFSDEFDSFKKSFETNIDDFLSLQKKYNDLEQQNYLLNEQFVKIESEYEAAKRKINGLKLDLNRARKDNFETAQFVFNSNQLLTEIQVNEIDKHYRENFQYLSGYNPEFKVGICNDGLASLSYFGTDFYASDFITVRSKNKTHVYFEANGNIVNRNSIEFSPIFEIEYLIFIELFKLKRISLEDLLPFKIPIDWKIE